LGDARYQECRPWEVVVVVAAAVTFVVSKGPTRVVKVLWELQSAKGPDSASELLSKT
jgi:hypothetical protein